MKTLEKGELYQNLQGFLKKKGVELKQGNYSGSIQKGCELLSDAINASQHGLARAKTQIDEKLDQLRQIIHEKTAPAGPPPAAQNSSPNPPKQTAKDKRESKKARTRKPGKKSRG